jgi:hypothetical protein
MKKQFNIIFSLALLSLGFSDSRSVGTRHQI